MRDESGYMMLLLLLPFHQQQTPTYTQQKQKWYGGIPPWQRASCPHKQVRSSVSKLEERPARGFFVYRARSGFYCTCSGCVFQPFSSRSGLTLTRKLALPSGPTVVHRPVFCFQDKPRYPRGGGGSFFGLWSCQTCRCHEVHISLVLNVPKGDSV